MEMGHLQLLSRKGKTFRKRFTLFIENRGKIKLGNNCFLKKYSTLAARESITIGENVKIYDQNHCFANPEMLIKVQGYKTSPIVIGKHCRIPSNVVILCGAAIGDRIIIGTGCVVSKDIPSDFILINEQQQTLKQIKFDI